MLPRNIASIWSCAVWRAILPAMRLPVLCCLLASLFLPLTPALCQEHREELQQVLEKQRSAWNKGDLETFMETYSKDPGLTFFSGDTVFRGWNQTLERYRLRYQAGGKQMGQLNFSETRIEMLALDAALVTARWHLTLPGGVKKEGLTTIVCRRSQTGWRIIHDHSS